MHGSSVTVDWTCTPVLCTCTLDAPLAKSSEHRRRTRCADVVWGPRPARHPNRSEGAASSRGACRGRRERGWRNKARQRVRGGRRGGQARIPPLRRNGCTVARGPPSWPRGRGSPWEGGGPSCLGRLWSLRAMAAAELETNRGPARIRP